MAAALTCAITVIANTTGTDVAGNRALLGAMKDIPVSKENMQGVALRHGVTQCKSAQTLLRP